jgi:hypothetical protein
MIDYVKECIKTFDSYASDDRKKIKTSAAPSNPFVNPDSKKLSKTSEVPQCGKENSICYKEGKTRHLDLVPCKKVRESDGRLTSWST